MAAVMEALADRSPTPAHDATDDSEDEDYIDERLRAEEKTLQRRREQERAKDGFQGETRAAVDKARAVGNLMNLVDRSQLYSSFLADQFKDVFDQTLAEAEGEGAQAAPEQPPAKRARTGRGKRAAPPPPPPPPPTATQRMLPMIRAEMRDYQLKGVAWLISLYKNGVNGILADEMGLGKTLQTIGFISYLWARGTATDKYMVVGPLSTLANWVAEFKRFCPDLPVLLYHGTPMERDELRHEHFKVGGKKRMPIIVTSYEIVMADRRHLERHTWKLVVVDEGHRLKNFECRLMRELRCLNMECRLLLTGTPLQNNLKELWSLLSFCMPAVFPDASQFLDWFDIRAPAAAPPPAITAPAAAPVMASASSPPAASGRPAAATQEPPAPQQQQAGQEQAPEPAKEQEEEPKRGRGRPRKNAAKGTTTAGPAPSVRPAVAAGAAPSAPHADGAAGGSGASAGPSGAGPAAAAAGAGPAAQQEVWASMVSRLHGILKPFVLRRVKADVNIGVPPKQEVVLYAEMTEEQRRLTRGLLDGTLKAEMAQEASDSGVSARTLNNLIMQLRKVCNHPDLITGPASGSTAYPSAQELVSACGKLALLHRLLKELLKEGHRVLIFSQMTEMLNVLDAYLADLGVPALRIDGSVPWQQRQQEIAEFQTGKSDKCVFLLSTRAGGLGINLTAADTVIIYDSDWNPHQDSQAMDRCHRIGQTRPVLVFRLVTAHSVENRMLARAESKKALERIIMKKGAFKELSQTTSSTSAAEVLELLNPDRHSGDVAQSGALSDEALKQLLDRSHLQAAHTRQQQAAAAGEDWAAAAGGTAPVPPYPLVGVGYEVVADEPRRAVGGLQRIEG